MMKTLLFGSGLAVGYVLGAKAGHERYEQIASSARTWGARSGLLSTSDEGAPDVYSSITPPAYPVMTDLSDAGSDTPAGNLRS